MQNTIIFKTNLNQIQFNFYYSLHVILYTLSNLVIGFLAYDLIFSRINLDRDNIIFISTISLCSLISLLYLFRIFVLKREIINSFQVNEKKIKIIDENNIDDLSNIVSIFSKKMEEFEKINIKLKENLKVEGVNDTTEKEKKNIKNNEDDDEFNEV